MKYRFRQYAEALYAALEDKTEKDQKKIARRFGHMLTRHRMADKARLILAAYEQLALKKSGMRKVRIESPGPVSAALKKEIIRALEAKVFFEEAINPELLAGVKILIDNEFLIDASAKRRLECIFKK